MKSFLRSLLLTALFLVPAFGQKASVPVQNPPAEHSADLQAIEPAPQPFQAEKAEEPATNYSMIRAAGGLGLVTFLMIAGYFGIRKLAPRFFSKGDSERNLKIIETLSMGDKRSISMIEVGSKRLLVGNTASQISLLMTLPESVSIVSEPEIDTLSGSDKGPSKKESSVPFRNLFEIEKKRPVQHTAHPLPEDIRLKMRQLREALER